MPKRRSLAFVLILFLLGCHGNPPSPAPRSAGSDKPGSDSTGEQYPRNRSSQSSQNRLPRESTREEHNDRSHGALPDAASGDFDGRHRSRRHARNAADDVPGHFDFYLLNLSWSPEFCATHTAPECAGHPGFVLHGLWPQNLDGTYPEHCSDTSGPQNPGEFADIYPDASLLHHEWETHGTCSGLDPEAFFRLARQALHAVQTPPDLNSLSQSESRPPAAILDEFAAHNPSIPRASLALSCGNNYLTAVEVCLDKSLTPVSCESIHSCRANAVRITPRSGGR